MAVEVCYNVWVIVHDQQGAFEDAQGGSLSFPSDDLCEDTWVDVMTMA